MENEKLQQKVVETLQYQYPNLDLSHTTFELAISKKTGRIKSLLIDNEMLFSLRINDGRFLPTMKGAEFMLSKGYTQNCVKITDEAVPFVSNGKSAYCKYITEVGENIGKGSVVIVLSPRNELIAVGTSNQPGYAMKSLFSGVAVKIKHHY